MMLHPRPIAALALVFGLSAAALAQPRQDGRWEMKMEMNMPGMPPNMPPITTVQCITPEDVKDPQKAMPQPGGRGGASNCTISDHKVAGNKVSWKMACTGAEPMTGTAEITYTDDTLVGVMTMNRAGQTMTMKYTGKRLGDCAK